MSSNNNNDSSSTSPVKNNNNNKYVEVSRDLITVSDTIDAYREGSTSYKKVQKKKLPTNSYYSIEFPANVQNPDKAIELVGGLNKISKAFGEKTYLPLKFRPNHVDSRPTFGSVFPTCNMLLRVRRVQDEGEAGKSQLDAKVIALVPSTIKYEGLCDFQYTVREKAREDKAQESKKGRNYFPSEFQEKEVGSIKKPLGTLPTLFSRVDFPQQYLFKVNPNMVFDEASNKFISHIREQPAFSKKSFVMENLDNIPTASIEPNARLMADSDFRETFELLKQMFEERPCWTFIVLADQASKRGATYSKLKIPLRFLAYYISRGPWRCVWVRNGYDPRYDPDSRLYQIWDFRVGETSRNDRYTQEKIKEREREDIIKQQENSNIDINEKAQPLVSVDGEHTVPLRKKAKNLFTFELQNKLHKTSENIVKFKYVPPYDYTLRTIPVIETNVVVQICDIEDPRIKAYFNSLPVNNICSNISGWYRDGFLDGIVKMIKKNIPFNFTKNTDGDLEFDLPPLEGLNQKQIEDLQRDLDIIKASSLSGDAHEDTDDDDDDLIPFSTLEDDLENNNNNGATDIHSFDPFKNLSTQQEEDEDLDLQRDDDEEEYEYEDDEDAR